MRIRRFQFRRWSAAVIGLLLGAALALTACTSRPAPPNITVGMNDPIPLDAVTAILDAFDEYPLVALGEAHGLKEQADFIADLIQHPDFPKKAGTIVIEAGNAKYQPLIDRYVAGEGVSLEKLRRVWRDHTCSALGPMDSPNLEQFFKTVRAVNEKLPLADRLRVLAGDPPIDWSRIRTNDDVRPWLEQRDHHYAYIVEKEVLEKGRKALLITGGAHLVRQPAPNGAPGGALMAQIIERKYPGRMFVVTLHLGFGARNDELEPRLATWPKPALALIKETWVGELDAGQGVQDVMVELGEPGGDKPPRRETLQDNADAYLYLGPRDALTMEQRIPDLFRDNGYVQELHRRHRIVHGRPLDLAELLKRRPKKYVDNFKEPVLFNPLLREPAAASRRSEAGAGVRRAGSAGSRS